MASCGTTTTKGALLDEKYKSFVNFCMQNIPDAELAARFHSEVGSKTPSEVVTFVLVHYHGNPDDLDSAALHLITEYDLPAHCLAKLKLFFRCFIQILDRT